MSSNPLPPAPPPSPLPPFPPPSAIQSPTARAADSGCSTGLVIGLAIAGVAGFLLVGALLLALLLPALAKARSAARMVKSGTQLRLIGSAMAVYASENNGALPEPGADVTVRLEGLGASANLWVSPSASAGSSEPSYILLFRAPSVTGSPATTPVVIENPQLDTRLRQVQVLFQDGHVGHMPVDDAWRLLRDPASQPRTPDGKPWTPPRE